MSKHADHQPHGMTEPVRRKAQAEARQSLAQAAKFKLLQDARYLAQRMKESGLLRERHSSQRG